MKALLRNSKITLAWLMPVGALFLLYAYGVRIAILAIHALPTGKETGPLDDPYPAWTAIHFVSALVFAVLALFQLVPIVRQRYPLVHRRFGRIAVGSGLIAAASGMAIPFGVAAARPLSEKLYIFFHFGVVATFLVLGFVAARGKRYRSHRVWMIRTVGAAGAVMTQRLIFPLAPLTVAIHSDRTFWMEFVISSAVALVINLVAVEWWLRRPTRPATFALPRSTTCSALDGR
jgi:hypothetical protein